MTTNEAQVSAVHAPGTELAPYAERPLEQYQPGLAMSPQQAKALDDQVRACTRAVLREGTDYGVIPGTGDTRKVLLKPGAEKLLQWFGFGFDCRCLEVERDDKGSKQGVTYRCTVTKRIGDPLHGLLVDVATCEGYAGYDEPKFWQSAGEAQRKAEAKERMWAKRDRRVANPEKWKHLGEYRAPWNTVIKMAQKRAIVGATIDATAAAGLFSADEMEDAPVPADGALSWYEQALETALTFTDRVSGQELWRETAAAAREGLCTPAQATHVQNRIEQRIKLLQRATSLDLEDAATMTEDHVGEQPSTATPQSAETSSDAGSKREPASDEAASAALLGIIARHFKRLGFTEDERGERLIAISTIAGRDITSSKELTRAEAKTVSTLLPRCRNREALMQLIVDGVDDHTNGEEDHQAPVTAARIGGGPPSAEPAGPVHPGGSPADTSLGGRAAPVTAPAPVHTGDGETAGGGITDRPSGDPAASPADQGQLRRISALFRQMDWTDREDRLRAASVLCGREITALSDVTAAEASELTETLARISREPDPAVALTAAITAARHTPSKEQEGG